MEFLKVWTSFREVIAPLNDSEKGRLFDAMLLYAENGEEPTEFRGNERFLWPVAKQDIDRTALKNDVLRANGLKGGRPKTKDNQTKPNETKENQTEPNESYKEKKSNIKKYKKETLLTECKEKRFVPPTVEEVEAYCRERGNSVNARMFVDFYSAKGWKIGKDPMKDWKASVRTWEQKGKQNKTVIAQDFQQRDYSEVNGEMMDELAAEMQAFREANA